MKCGGITEKKGRYMAGPSVWVGRGGCFIIWGGVVRVETVNL